MAGVGTKKGVEFKNKDAQTTKTLTEEAATVIAEYLNSLQDLQDSAWSSTPLGGYGSQYKAGAVAIFWLPLTSSVDGWQTEQKRIMEHLQSRSLQFSFNDSNHRNKAKIEVKVSNFNDPVLSQLHSNAVGYHKDLAAINDEVRINILNPHGINSSTSSNTIASSVNTGSISQQPQQADHKETKKNEILSLADARTIKRFLTNMCKPRIYDFVINPSEDGFVLSAVRAVHISATDAEKQAVRRFLESLSLVVKDQNSTKNLHSNVIPILNAAILKPMAERYKRKLDDLRNKFLTQNKTTSNAETKFSNPAGSTVSASAVAGSMVSANLISDSKDAKAKNSPRDNQISSEDAQIIAKFLNDILQLSSYKFFETSIENFGPSVEWRGPEPRRYKAADAVTALQHIKQFGMSNFAIDENHYFRITALALLLDLRNKARNWQKINAEILAKFLASLHQTEESNKPSQTVEQNKIS